MKTAQGAFHDAIVAWSEVETIRIGPVTEQNRLDRILFWPDRKSIGLKQVQGALAGEDPTAADAKQLAGKSVAMQGFGALEFVLYGTGSEELQSGARPYRCKFGAAIAGNLASMAADISTAWSKPDGFAAQWANPKADNALYRTDTEALSELVDILVQGLEMVRDVRIKGFLGLSPAKDKPKQALYWRSNQTLASLTANMDGLRKLYAASGIGKTLGADNAHVDQSISIVFANAGKVLPDLGAKPVADVLDDPAARAKLERFQLTTSALSELIGVRLTGALGLSAGFSSLDGD